ncbi:uncharacterized protein LOC113231971 [Hyposmocoma kahamanoa]|uniref:uncharacterized protein LOC113231971 n=1 Tax=Hyposmocoma kahamanoa TaxID=1477025 RepID=UPI000E6D83C9|nr:uncharacterized protein LOC113231971 [Hyposmocoma kahamanoa]
MPAECAKQNYCEYKHEKYPGKLFKNLLNDTLNIATNQITGQRRGEHTEFEEVCKQIDEYVTIYEIIDEHDNTRFVAQTDDNKFKNENLIGRCQYPGKIMRTVPLLTKPEIDTNEYTLYCEDITTEFMFLVLSHDGNSLENVKSKEIPVGCACRYRSKH